MCVRCEAQVNVPIELPSRNRYMLIGSAIALSGEATEANFAMIKTLHLLREVQQRIIRTPDALHTIMRAHGAGEDTDSAIVELRIDDRQVVIVEQSTGALLHRFSSAEEQLLFGRRLASHARHLGLA